MNKDVRRLEKDFRKQKKGIITDEDKKEIKVQQETYIQKFWLNPEFWFFGFARFCFGASNTAFLDLLDEMSLGHRSTALQAADVIQCYELVGLLLSGFFLNYLRDYFNPLNLTNWCLVLNVLLQLFALNLVNNQNWYF
jgi:fucose permease